MRKVLLGLLALPFLATAGLAGEARPLTDKQMDTVTAGYIIAIPIAGCGCYLYIRPQPGPPGTMTPMMQASPIVQMPTHVQPSLGFRAFL
jgi:hypothetical protein